MPPEVTNWIKSTAIMIKSVKDNLAKEYKEDRLKAQTGNMNVTNTTIMEDKSKTPSSSIKAPNVLDAGIYVDGAAKIQGSLNKTEEDKLLLTIKDLQAKLKNQNDSIQKQSKDYAARLIAFEKEKLVWQNETRRELDRKKKLFEKIMKEQREKYENATMVSLKGKIIEQQVNLDDLKANVTTITKLNQANKDKLKVYASNLTLIKEQNDKNKAIIQTHVIKEKKLKLELEAEQKEHQIELAKMEKEYESELQEVVAKMNSTFFDALKNETLLLEQRKCGAGAEKNTTEEKEEPKSTCNETLAGWKDKGYRGCQTKTRKGYTC